MWYEEYDKYSYNNLGFIKVIGYFMQIVWQNFKEMGVGKVVSFIGV